MTMKTMILPMILMIGIVFAGHGCAADEQASQTTEPQQRTDFVLPCSRPL